MQVIHVRTAGASSVDDAAFIQMVVGLVDGVRDIASVPSMGLISVLFDDARSDRTDIIEAVCSAGYEAHECRPTEILAIPAAA